MTAAEMMCSDAFERCKAFHGHVCPGLCIGFRAATAAMEWLKTHRSEDEEIVAIVETDACAVDAVQVLTGCTFGKGNFIYKDYGKMAVTLLSRNTGRGVRVAAKGKSDAPDPEHMALIRKRAAGAATAADEARFQELHHQRSRLILEAPVEALFSIRETAIPLPGKAVIEPSIRCGRCGEPTMASRLTTVEEGRICRGCLARQPD